MKLAQTESVEAQCKHPPLGSKIISGGRGVNGNHKATMVSEIKDFKMLPESMHALEEMFLLSHVHIFLSAPCPQRVLIWVVDPFSP